MTGCGGTEREKVGLSRGSAVLERDGTGRIINYLENNKITPSKTGGQKEHAGSGV